MLLTVPPGLLPYGLLAAALLSAELPGAETSLLLLLLVRPVPPKPVPELNPLRGKLLLLAALPGPVTTHKVGTLHIARLPLHQLFGKARPCDGNAFQKYV